MLELQNITNNYKVGLTKKDDKMNFDIFSKIFKRKKTLGIALGSGGAKGAVEVGALKRLMEEGILPKEISGSSIGAIVAAYFSAGKFDKIIKHIDDFNTKEFLKHLDPSFKLGGLVKGDKIIKFLKRDLGDIEFKDLKIKTKIVATDLYTGKPVIFTSGSVLKAIRASISVPFVFLPVKYKKTYLVDGGVTEPLPLDVLDTDFKLGIDLSYIKTGKIPLRLIEITFRSTSYLEKQLIEYKYKNRKDVMIISPKISIVNPFNFDKLKELYHRGYKEMDKVIEEVKKRI